MLRRTLVYLKQNVLALLALIIAMGTGSAYAANTVFSTDIVDGQVKSVDIGDNEIGSADVKDGTINTFDVHSFIGEDVIDGTLTGADVANTSSLGSQDIGEEGLLFNNTLVASDIASGAVGIDEVGSQAVGSDEVVNDSLLQSDIRAGAVTNDEVLDNSLIGADIDESTLTSTATATFGFVTVTQLPNNGSLVKVASKNLPAGAFAVIAHANLDSAFPFAGDLVRTAACELRNGNTFIGGAHDRRVLPDDDQVLRNLSISGGAQVPGGGGEVSMWCSSQAGSDVVSGGHMMIIRLGGFF